MSIFDVIKDRESRKQFETDNSAAIKAFDDQKKSFVHIKESEGFKVIKKFWEAEKEAALKRLLTAKQIDEEARATFLLAEKFLKFLEGS